MSMRGLLATDSSKVAAVSFTTSEAASARTKDAKARRHAGELIEERRMVDDKKERLTAGGPYNNLVVLTCHQNARLTSEPSAHPRTSNNF